MGALTDFVANVTTYDKSDQSAGIDRSIKRYFDELAKVQGDPAYPAGYTAVNEVHSIATHVPTVTGGTFALTITLWGGETFTTAGIAFDAVAATIETAIDVAATAASITDWTNGDISVSGGDLNTAAVVLTFDGASVSGANHALTVIDGALLTGGGSAGVVTTTTPGQGNRSSYAVMSAMNVVSGTPPVQGTVSPLTVVGTRGSMHLSPGAHVLRALATQAAIDDNNSAIEDAILDGLRDNGVVV